MNCASAFALLGIALLPLGAAQTTSTPSTSTPSKSVHAKPKTASSKSAAGRKVTRSSRRAAPRPSYQLHPDPERYQQIQQALADRGYFKGQVNGQWGDDSVDALKRFQADQKLDNDGKINALTLTGLGLGPKHTAGSAPAPSPAPSSTESQTPAPATPPR